MYLTGLWKNCQTVKATAVWFKRNSCLASANREERHHSPAFPQKLRYTVHSNGMLPPFILGLLSKYTKCGLFLFVFHHSSSIRFCVEYLWS